MNFLVGFNASEYRRRGRAPQACAIGARRRAWRGSISYGTRSIGFWSSARANDNIEAENYAFFGEASYDLTERPHPARRASLGGR